MLRFAFFLYCGSFSPQWPLAFLIFSAAITVACFLSDEIRLRRFFSLAQALSLLSASVQTLNFSRKDSALLLFFVSESSGSRAVYRQTARLLEVRNFTPAYMKGWTYRRAYVRMILSQPKFLGCIDNQIFLGVVYMTPGRLSRRREITPVPSHGSIFVQMIPSQNVMPARVTPA